MTEEVILAAIPLSIDVAIAGKLLKAVSEAFPEAMVRDSEHSGYYQTREHGDNDMRACLEILLPANPVTQEAKQ